MVNITINNKKIQVAEGKSVLETALENGIDIPTLCYHKDLSPYGVCRICIVEIGSGEWTKLKASCIYIVKEGLEVQTNSEKVKRARKLMFELLLARCPDSESIRKLAEKWGVKKTRIKFEKTSTCVLCGLCVRVCTEISQRNAINFAGRGIRRKVQTPFNKINKICIGCKACEYVCPTDCISIEEDE